MRRELVLLSLVIALCLAGSAPAQTTVYVDGSVATTGNGTQAAPFKTIAEGLAKGASFTVRVAGGTYTEEPADTRILTGQTLIGSYDSSFSASDPSVTPTVIDMARLTQQQQDRTFRCQGVTAWTIENLVIQNSTSGEFGDTDNGGAMYVQSGSQGTIRGVTFLNCATKFEGGVESGPAREGGAVCIRDASTVVFEDCVFDSCTAVGGGGAVRMRNAGGGNNVKFHRCVFTHCGARGNGSVIDDGDGVSQVEIVNCLFANNGVEVVVPSGTAPSTYLIRVSDKRALLYNCTFVGNNNPAGYMFNVGDSSDAAAAKEIVNCLIANNTIAGAGSIFSYASGYNDATTLQNNLFFSNSGLNPLDPTGAGIIGTNGNLAGEPQFIDAANGDYHLKAGSPGVDAGQTLALVTDDLDGTVRPVGAAYDIGALEGQGSLDPLFYKVQGITATASSSLSADSGPQKTVDRSGLNLSDQHDATVANMWASAGGQQPPVWIQYEFDTVYKLNEMWVWNSNSELEWLFGWGVKTATMEYSTDGTTWTALANVPEFARAPGVAGYAHNTTVDFGGVAAQFVRITCTSSWGGGGQYGLSEVRFFYIPVSARDPKPATGAKGVPVDTTLSWKAGREAASHEIHLGTDLQAVTDSVAPVATVSQTTYAPADLQLDTTYYWKVVEVNEAEAISTWAGPVWSFTTAAYLVVDDMESYTDVEPDCIYNAWADGFVSPGVASATNGALVGYDSAPFAEKTTTHGGSKQSMPFRYGQSTAPTSEATRTFAPAQDWTRLGVKTLVIYFHGLATNTTGQLYVKINGTQVAYSGAAGDLAADTWTQWNIDLPVAAGLGAVQTLTIGVSGGRGTLYFDDIQLK